MADEKQISIAIEATPEMRTGTFSDLSLIKTNGAASTIDFILTDGVPDEQGNVSAVLVSRISMTNESVIALRDMLVRHTDGWTVEGDADGR